MVDLGEAVFGATDEDFLAVVQPLAQHLLQAHHHGHLALGEHVHVQGKAVLQVRQLEQGFHQQRRVDIARSGHQNDADVFRRFIADIFQKRQLACGQELGDLLDQPGLRYLVGDLGDHHVPLAAAEVFHLPAGADPEAATSRDVGFADRGLVGDEKAAGREIRALDELQQFAWLALRILDQVL